jgi:hypothetical protein
VDAEGFFVFVDEYFFRRLPWVLKPLVLKEKQEGVHGIGFVVSSSLSSPLSSFMAEVVDFGELTVAEELGLDAGTGFKFAALTDRGVDGEADKVTLLLCTAAASGEEAPACAGEVGVKGLKEVGDVENENALGGGDVV